MKKLFLVLTMVLVAYSINATSVSNGKVMIQKLDWGAYGGYQLGNDGCYHHGTFFWSGDITNTVFVSDNGCNNSGECSTGFEDFCMDDEEFSGLC